MGEGGDLADCRDGTERERTVLATELGAVRSLWMLAEVEVEDLYGPYHPMVR